MKNNLMDTFLELHGSTRYAVHKATGLSQTTLFNNSAAPLEQWKFKTIIALAETVDIPIYQAVIDLLDMNDDINKGDN